MKATKRFILQILFWLVIWLILWSQQQWDSNFISNNVFVFIAQILLVGSLIFYAVPKFLFSKKYTIFVSFSILIVIAFSFLAIKSPQHPIPLNDFPQNRMPPSSMTPPRMDANRNSLEQKQTRKPPSHEFTMVLLLVTSYSLAIVIEILLFARKKEEEVILSKNENLQTELKLLKSQINPHFLFNSLNNIYALSVIDSNKTQESISNLSNMLRYVLYECELPFVPLQKEIDYIENYIKLFSLKSSTAYPINTIYKVTNPQAKIAPMILIPFVENALKHSNIERIKDTFINLELTETEGLITFSLTNSIAATAVSKDSVGGIGLENVKKRLQIIYPHSHSLAVEAEATVFKIDLKLNING
ncbi:sensor histidine kinase [Cellulophaga sp. F20128]|uniref:sensor histidine kinase n=1 Tax=Cellulophaga sp. F20128 TaxID=2926413 RepID=UPI001FF144B1|nr:sensor histidine kinase [Cellulophaga sp. F20128]MCK0156776.1 sensor histidine kinase [Cellulophaga sp. F20128]